MGDKTVTIADLTLHDGPYVPADDDGCRWIVTSLGGWFDSPGPRAEPLERPGADGDYDGEPTLDAHTITVEGTVIAPDRPTMRGARDRVTAVLTGATRYGTLTVAETSPALSRQAVVRLGGQTLTQRIGENAASFSLSLFAPDPRRYSSDLHSVTVGPFAPGGGRAYDLTFDRSYGDSGSSGIASVNNAGTVATWPTLKFSGPLTNPSARLVGGSTVAAAIILAAGQDLAVDNGLRSVLLGSASRRQFLTDDGFFALPPGDSQVYFSADDGAGTLTVEWRDAW